MTRRSLQLICFNTVRLYYEKVTAVQSKGRPRTRRADKAERTRQAIMQAASELFAGQGFAATTISAISTKADVAAETVYSRFGNKLTLISEILETAIVGDAPRVDVLDLPEIAAIRAITDQRTQLARLAHLSRGILQRTARSPIASCETPAPPTPHWPNSSPQTVDVATGTKSPTLPCSSATDPSAKR